ncbi:unnamed protein product [Clonostachys solani]|uniref:Zn(2)-C6 fungal-type domain-containing protein n=1 Tax=Clonostachys solani TaxID=160281 RepID=A0A9N9ZHU6_9HYPO|nr:unnamed protein product [Clonostachys solani]
MISSASQSNDGVQVPFSASSTRAGRPGARTKYAPKACQECRRRRAKCGGERPSCSRCCARQIACTYTTESDGRGTAQKSYVRLLQTRIEFLERILSFHSIDIESSAAYLSPRSTQPPKTNTDSTVEAVGCSSSPENPSSALQGILTDDEPLNVDGNGETRYFGSTSGRHDLCRQLELPLPLSPALPSGHSIQATQPGVQSEEDLESHLLELYFRWEQPWLQVVDETLFRWSRKTGGRYCSDLLLNSILANGSRFSDRVDIRTDIADSNSAGQAFKDKAELLLYDELRQPGITTLQALTVLGTVSIAMGQDATGWMYHGMANRLLYDLGLNIDPSALPNSLRLTAEEVELRRQIYWSLYCVDKLASGYTGRVCMMLDLQGAVNLPSSPTASPTSIDSDADGLARKRRLVSFHNSLISLCKILEEIFMKYAPKNIASEDQKHAIFETCKLSLRSWFYELSEEFKFHKAATRNGVLPQVVALQMVYHTSVILLAKPFISRHPACEDDASKSGQPSNGFTKTAIALYIGAAREVSVLSDQYREVFGSFRLSPITPTHSNLSATLALLSSCSTKSHSINTASGTLERIGSCLQTLGELSTSWTPARRYYESLRNLIKDRGIEIPNASQQIPVSGLLNDKSALEWTDNPDPNIAGEDLSWLTWLSTIDNEWGNIEGMGLFDLPLDIDQEASHPYPSSMPWQ